MFFTIFFAIIVAYAVIKLFETGRLEEAVLNVLKGIVGLALLIALGVVVSLAWGYVQEHTWRQSFFMLGQVSLWVMAAAIVVQVIRWATGDLPSEEDEKPVDEEGATGGVVATLLGVPMLYVFFSAPLKWEYVPMYVLFGFITFAGVHAMWSYWRSQRQGPEYQK